MDSPEALAQAFVGIWNEPDRARRRATVERLWRPDGRHLMGSQDARGQDELEARVATSHQRSVVEQDNRFRPPTAIQSLPGLIKFRWDMVRQASGEVVSAGVGLILLDDDGRIACDYLFTEV
jgi:hypothetical protein